MGSTLAAQTGTSSRRSRAFGAGLIALLLFILTGCGAVINTTFTVDADGSGQRVMSLELSASDAENLTGGAAAAEASIKKHLPSELQFSGLQTAADGTITGAFTLSFADSQEYRDKATALLELGDEIGEIEFDLSSSLLKSGVVLNEDFTSQALLAWMFNGLEADGVLGSDVSAGDRSEIGSTTFVFGALSLPQSRGMFNVSELVDNGFASVSMRTDISDPDAIKRTIVFESPWPVTPEQTELFERYIAAQTPTGAQLRQSGSDWEMSFSGNANAIARHTATALANDQVTFELSTGPAEFDPASFEVRVSQFAPCSEVCAAENSEIVDQIEVSELYSPASADMYLSEPTTEVFLYSPAFVSVTQSFDLDFFSGVTYTGEFVVANEDVESVGEGFQQLLTPLDGSGSFDVNRGDELTTFKVSISGADAREFGERFNAWAGGNAFDWYESDGFWLGETAYMVDAALPELIGTHPVESFEATKFNVPLFKWVSDGSVDETYSGVIMVSVQGFAVSGLITAGILLVLVAAIVVLLVVYRKRIKAWLESSQSGAQLPLGELDPNPAGADSALALISQQLLPSSSAVGGSLTELPAEAPAPINASVLNFPLDQAPGVSAEVSLTDVHFQTTTVILSDSLIQFDSNRKNDDV